MSATMHYAAQRNTARERIVDREVAKLEARQAAFKQFTTLPTIDGYDVIDELSGHAVDHRDSLLEASGAAYRLNMIAAGGGVAHVFGGRNRA